MVKAKKLAKCGQKMITLPLEYVAASEECCNALAGLVDEQFSVDTVLAGRSALIRQAKADELLSDQQKRVLGLSD